MSINLDNLNNGLRDMFRSIDGSSGATGSAPKDMAKKLAKLQQLADKADQEFESEDVYYDSFDGLNEQFIGQIDLVSLSITTNSFFNIFGVVRIIVLSSAYVISTTSSVVSQR